MEQYPLWNFVRSGFSVQSLQRGRCWAPQSQLHPLENAFATATAQDWVRLTSQTQQQTAAHSPALRTVAGGTGQHGCPRPKGGKNQGGAKGSGQKVSPKQATARKKDSSTKRRAKKKAVERDRSSELLRQCAAYCLQHDLAGKSGITSRRDAKKFESVPKASLSRHLKEARGRIKLLGLNKEDLVGEGADHALLDSVTQSTAAEDTKILTTYEILVWCTSAMVLTRMGRVWGPAATAPPDRRASVVEGLLWTPTRIASPPEPLSPPDCVSGPSVLRCAERPQWRDDAQPLLSP
jgi:hypothetical protein